MSIFDQSFGQQSSNCFGIYHPSDDNASRITVTASPTHPKRLVLPHDDEALLLEKEDQQKKKEIDDLLSQAMSGLTFKEREETQEVIHGVANEIVEDASLLDTCLVQLDGHLAGIKRGNIYEMAESMSPQYVSSRAFRIMFLRAKEYDAKASAEQMIRFFELKHQLFGIEKLVKDITMDDLDEHDIECLKAGWVQVAGRDRSGRQIFVFFGSMIESSKRPKCVTRVLYFVMMRAMQQSEETQIRGNISVWYTNGDFRSKTNGKGYFENFTAAQALPQKKAAIHFCVDEMRQFVLTNVVVKVMQSKLRARLRIHFGSQTECQYQLSTYGIMPQTLPLDANGSLLLDQHLHWVHCCAMEDKFGRSVSAPEALESSIITPHQKDVIFTGGKNKNHEGNKRFYVLVHEHSQEYDSSGNDEQKRQIVSTIIDETHRIGGRFLQKQGTQSKVPWKEVPYDDVRRKVMQAFRNRRRQSHFSRQKGVGTNPTNNCVLIQGEPRPNDVIFGRVIQRNPGSELLHRLIKDHFEEYEALNRGVKIRLVETVMQIITDQGGRFLQPASEEGRWLEVPKESARERVSKYFRNHRRGPSSSSNHVR
ncbi:unnamed protein product [Cylindrotheca closterium]|uniref:DUF6824 domain-containing protein n=1 Tax=Cylindrotheca closterium TaxID=2856 RepID=A0AAD2JIV6_9STRA|nr:unnamed protein product [Cylindrotheca closterium]